MDVEMINSDNCTFRRIYKPHAKVTVKLIDGKIINHNIHRFQVTGSFIIMENDDERFTVTYSSDAILYVKIIIR